MGGTEHIELQDPRLGKVIGGEFTVLQKIGAGGMGAVYRAVQQGTDRIVAVKILHGHLADGVLMRRFAQEAKIISALNHPNIVTIYKHGQADDGNLYIAMEFVDGSSLADLIVPEWFFDARRALPLMLQMADALAYAHQNNIIHRDIKPENMMLTKRGRTELIKILDFGIAKIVGDSYVQTKTGALCGSPPYMSPEQWQQLRDLDGRTDVYSLGCVFYQMVTGRTPFHADSTVGFMKAHLKGDPPSPLSFSDSLAELPQLADVIVRCIQRDRNNRFADADQLLEALKEVQRDVDALPRRPTGGALPAITAQPAAAASTPSLEGRATPLEGDPHTAPTLPGGGTVGERSACSRSSADNLKAQGAGTNLGLASSRPRLRPTPTSSSLQGGPTPTDPTRHRSSWGARSVSSADIEGGSSLTHRLFVAAGVLLLLFLALAGTWFWLQDRSLEQAAARPPASQSAPRAPDGGRSPP